MLFDFFKKLKLNFNFNFKFIENINISFENFFNKNVFISPSTKKIEYSISYKILNILIKISIIIFYSIISFLLFKYFANDTIRNFSLFNIPSLTITHLKIIFIISFLTLIMSCFLFIKELFSKKNYLFIPIFISLVSIFIVSKYPFLIISYNK